MEKMVREQIIELLTTVWEGVKYVKKQGNESQIEIIGDCIESIGVVKNVIHSQLSVNRRTEYIRLLDSCLSLLVTIKDKLEIGEIPSETAKKLKGSLNFIKKQLYCEPEIKIEIVFFPYKMSMWDCMESVWRAAVDDKRCHVSVVPIPYYEKDEKGGNLHRKYEGNEFPKYVPIIDYQNYDYQIIRPDIIFIHNPYDGENLVTSIDQNYFSNKLKKYTDNLVYIPYFVEGGYKSYKDAYCVTPAAKFVDYIVVQSDIQKSFFIHNGIDEKKLLTLGSPKIDYLLYHLHDYDCIPESWKNQLKGKKIFLLNTALETLLRSNTWTDNYIEYILVHFMKPILEKEQCGLIWRPHPLFEATLISMRPFLLESYNKLKEFVAKSESIIIDTSPSYLPSFILSDAMISDTSSLAIQYIATEKPVCFLLEQGTQISEYMFACDYSQAVFIEHGCSVTRFVEQVIQGIDFKKELRLQTMKSSVAHSDGTSGIAIHHHFVNEVLKQR